jgi:hypothetical protein
LHDNRPGSATAIEFTTFWLDLWGSVTATTLAALSSQCKDASQDPAPYARRLHIAPANSVLKSSADMRLGVDAVFVQKPPCGRCNIPLIHRVTSYPAWAARDFSPWGCQMTVSPMAVRLEIGNRPDRFDERDPVRGADQGDFPNASIV